MRILNHQKRREDARTLPKLPQNRISTSMNFACSAFGVRCVLASLFLSAIPVYAADAPFGSASISGLGARNIGSAAMSGRISCIAGVHEPSGKITLFVGAASGGVWKSDDSGTRYRPVFDEQRDHDSHVPTHTFFEFFGSSAMALIDWTSLIQSIRKTYGSEQVNRGRVTAFRLVTESINQQM